MNRGSEVYINVTVCDQLSQKMVENEQIPDIVGKKKLSSRIAKVL